MMFHNLCSLQTYTYHCWNFQQWHMWVYMYVYRPLTNLHGSIYLANILLVGSRLIEKLLAQIENYTLLQYLAFKIFLPFSSRKILFGLTCVSLTCGTAILISCSCTASSGRQMTVCLGGSYPLHFSLNKATCSSGRAQGLLRAWWQ